MRDDIATPKRRVVSKVESLLEGIEEFKKEISILLFSGHASPNGLQAEDGNEAYGIGVAKNLNSKECPNLKLVFLNGCTTKDMVGDLLDNGVPVVIYTYSPVGDEQAAIFSKAFFKSLAGTNNPSEGRTIQDAFARANAAVKNHGGDKISVTHKRIRGSIELNDTIIDENNWGCLYKDSYAFEAWKIDSRNEESINPSIFEDVVSTKKDLGYNRLEMLRNFLYQLEDSKKNIKNETEILEIESLCLHIENEIKKIRLNHNFQPKVITTNNHRVKYSFLDNIGVGSFSNIYKAERTDENSKSKPVAFKVLLPSSDTDNIKNKIFQYKNFRYPNLAEYITESFGNKFEYYVTEFAGNINLAEYISNNKEKKSDNKEKKSRQLEKEKEAKELNNIKKIVKEVSKTLDRLHIDGHAHMDIRPSNIIIETELNEIQRVTLIDWDDFVPKGSNEFEPHFKSNPYLDRRIFQNNLDKGDFIVYKQADIYALTLVVLFCIVL